MVKKIGMALIIAVVAFLGYCATRPDTIHVQREAVIKAPPEKIYALINDFHSWTAWSPYEKKDPAMKRVYSGAESGKGAIYEWNGDDNVGQGRMEIAETVVPAKIKINLDFLKPFAGHNTAEFTLAKSGDATKLTWAMDGQCHFCAKVMQTFINMDEMIGKDFADGLANIKAIVEKQNG